MADPMKAGDFEIHVVTAAGPPAVFSPIADMTAYDRSTARAVTKTKVFGRATPYAGTGTRDVTYTLAGLANDTDPGQLALLAAEEADEPIVIRVNPKGSDTDGFTQEVKVTSKKHSARADGEFQEMTIDLSANADPVTLATGVVI